MNEQFKTSDFYVAAFCKTKGMKLCGMDKTNPKRAVFLFEDTEDRPQLVEDFWQGRAIVEPQAFVSNIRSLKQMLFSDSFNSEDLE